MDIIQQLNNAIRQEQYSIEFWLALANSNALRGFYKQQALHYADEEKKHKLKLENLRTIMIKYQVDSENWIDAIKREAVLDAF